MARAHLVAAAELENAAKEIVILLEVLVCDQSLPQEARIHAFHKEASQ